MNIRRNEIRTYISLRLCRDSRASAVQYPTHSELVAKTMSGSARKNHYKTAWKIIGIVWRTGAIVRNVCFIHCYYHSELQAIALFIFATSIATIVVINGNDDLKDGTSVATCVRR